MEKSLWVFIYMCSALLEVQSLECYVCDNCSKVKLDQIETCGSNTVMEQSTTKPSITDSPTTTIVAAKTEISPTSTTLKSTTKAATEATTISSTISTDAITTSLKTTEASPTTTITKEEATISSTETKQTSETWTMKPINIPTTNPTEPTNNPMNTITSTSRITNAIIEPQTIKIPAEAAITTEPISLTTITDSTVASTETANTKEAEEDYLSEPQRVTLTESSTVNSSDWLISTLPTTTVPIAPSASSGPTIESISAELILSEQNAVPIIQNIPTIPPLTAGPVATFTEEPTATFWPTDQNKRQSFDKLSPETLPSSRENAEPVQNIPTLPSLTARPKATFTTQADATEIPIVSNTNYPESTRQRQDTYNIRRIRSLPEGCVCQNEQTCDCWSQLSQARSKRYALRGLGLSNESVKYVCFIDKYRVNETEVVKRGCAVKEEDKTSCTTLGFGVNCKICGTNQCNGATIIQSSTLLLFTLYMMLQ